MKVKSVAWPCLFLLVECGTSGPTNSEGTQVRKYRTIINFDNESDSEPDADLEIRYDDSTVFSGVVRYNGVADDWNSESAVSVSAGPHQISIVNKDSGVRLDTLVANVDTLTHVFFTYSYHVLTTEEKTRFKKTAYNPEEEKLMYSMFAKPKRFSVLVMSGQISIP